MNPDVKKVLDFLTTRKFGIGISIAGCLSNLYLRNLPAAFWAGALAVELYLAGRKNAA